MQPTIVCGVDTLKIWVDVAGAEAREQAYGVFTLKIWVDAASGSASQEIGMVYLP